MADLAFLVLVGAFFAVAALFVRACALVLGRRSLFEDEREP